MIPRRIAVLSSGGLDSNILLAEMLRRSSQVYPVYVHSGLYWEKAELHWLRKYLKAVRQKGLQPLTVLDIPVVDVLKGWAVTGRSVPGYRSADEKVYLPGRNLLLLSKASVFCALNKIPAVALGTLASNPFPDATPKFFRAFEKAAGGALAHRFRVLTPFAGLKKQALLARGRDLPLHLSFSCLSPSGVSACGRCNKCAEKDKVLKLAL